MKKFIDFGIGKSEYSTKNIFGNNVETVTKYYIYKCWLWGLFKVPLRFSIKSGWNIAANVDVNYADDWNPTRFNTIYECNQLIEDIKKNPNKYILKY